jgi:gliding motility-associated-like protein
MKPLSIRSKAILGILSAIIILNSNTALAQCGCNFVISLSAAEFKFDGIAKGVKPGDKICFASGTRVAIYLDNINGTAAKPVIISNMCDGKVTIKNASTASYGIEVHRSSFFQITGAANPAEKYGITVDGGNMGLDIKELSTNFEVNNLKVFNTGYAGIVAKTDPTCNPNTWRGNFTMRNTSFHDNDVSTLGGEGFYIGSSHYYTTVSRVCGGSTIQVQEHEQIGVHVYNNTVHDTGRDGIQVGSTTSDCSIHHNTVYNFGVTNEFSQQTGIQINPGTNADCYNNVVNKGTGYGVFLGGRGGSRLYNNVIMNSLQGGIICQDYAPVDPTGYIISNNTLVNNNDYGIYMFSQNTSQNQFINNIIIASTQPTFQYVRLNNPAAIKWTDVNNIKTNSSAALKFVNPNASSLAYDFRLQTGSSAIDFGKDVTSYGFTFDLDDKARPKGGKYDAGAYEFQPAGPKSNAGLDKTITLPTNSIIINGTGTSATGITGYTWTKKSGGVATLANANTADLSLSGLAQGIYVFELQVKDASGLDFDDVTVTVLPAAANQNPTADAGLDKIIVLPTNTLTINGIGKDLDGTVTGYQWTQVSGPSAATLTNAGAPNLGLSALIQGVYVFQLTVTDDKTATGSDQVTVTVNPASVNQLPIVNSASPKTIFLPTNQITLTATASDPDGTIASILWTKKSGGVATLGTTNALTFNVTGLVQGTYTFRITVTDDKTATSFADVVVNVLLANQSPTADAGIDQLITLPTNSATLPGIGTDLDGTINSFGWVQVSGPSIATLANANTNTLSVSNLIQGNYVFGLTVTDNNTATGYDEVIVAVSPVAVVNEPPLAFSGGNLSFSLPTSSANLYGSGFDPDGTITTYSWAKASGGAAVLTNAGTPTLTVSGLQAGQYSFKLTVTDDKGGTNDDIAIVTVSAAGTNIFPVASAGADKIVKLPQTSTLLLGSGTDVDGQIASYAWTQVSGAATTISTPANASTNIFGLALGTYQFRLTVTDDLGASDFSDITVRVVASSNNLPPLVDAGPDVKIFAPQSTLTINGAASDDGSITTIGWVQLSGPAATLNNTNQLNLSLTGLVQGEYTFQLTVTDNNSASVFDVVKVSVLPNTFTPPVVTAQVNPLTITLPIDQVTLTGSATSANSTIVSQVWTIVSGPTATLVSPNSLTCQVTNMLQGTYVFRLTATDNNTNQTFASVQVIVSPIPPNQPPLVNAGSNKQITLPISGATLVGSATDSDGTIVTTQWTQMQGPSTATLQNASTTTLTVSNLVEGNYEFKLTATDDKTASSSASAFVLVSKPPAKSPPNVFAGGSITVTLPKNDTTVIADATTPNGFVDRYIWKQVSGVPASFNDQGASIHISDLVPGYFTFELTVIDSDTISASDVLKVQVIEKNDEIPKFFTPNSDGVSESWEFRNIDSYKECKLIVFSRSGQTVFESAPYTNNWNGTYNGKPLGDGDYYYNIKCSSGREINGAVRIIR